MTVGFELTLRQEAFSAEDHADRGTSQTSEYQALINFQSRIQDNVSAKIQIASGYGSGSTRPITSNFQQMEGQFSSKDLWLRQAYVNWQPSQVEGSNVFAGKIPNIFKCVGGHHGNQLIWDYDVMHEGAAGNYVKSLDDSTTLNTNAGAFWVEEGWSSSSPAPDIMLYAAQAYVVRRFDETSRCLAGASFYSYSNIINQTGFASGNTETGGRLANDFDLLELFAECSREINGIPCMLFGSWVNNTAAVSSNQDTAWIIGGSFDPCPLWTLGYDYRDVEADSVIGLFTDNYFVHGGVGANGAGSRGHSFTGSYHYSENIELACRVIISEDLGSGSGPDEDFNFLFVDLVFNTR